MAKERLSEIVKLLIENSKAGIIRWEKTSSKGNFQTSFSKYSMVIEGPPSGPTLMVYDEEGDVVEDLSSTDAYVANITDEIRELYELARRNALGADQALDEILNILRRPSGVKN